MSMMHGGFGGTNEWELQERGMRGDSDAMFWYNARVLDRELDRRGAPTSQSLSGGFDLGCVLMLAVPLIAVYLVVVVLANGVSAIANASLFAPLFPRPGDSVARYVISVLTLLAIFPGGLVLLARALRGRRLHVLRRVLLYPLAMLLVPAILMMTVFTTSAETIRLAS